MRGYLWQDLRGDIRKMFGGLNMFHGYENHFNREPDGLRLSNVSQPLATKVCAKCKVPKVFISFHTSKGEVKNCRRCRDKAKKYYRVNRVEIRQKDNARHNLRRRA